MKLKTVTIEGKTYAEVDDGKPVYEAEDGKLIPFDALGTRDTISRLNAEAKSHRQAKEAAETALKSFDGLDAAAARDALDKLSKIDAKKLVEAGDMDAAVQAALKPYTEKLTAAEKREEELSGALSRALIGSGFSQSKFATEKLTPAGVDLVRSMFADRMKVENGTVVGYDQNGQKLYSKARPGELASFDEVVETLVDAYPFKEHILKGTGGGSGTKPSNGSGAGGKTISRGEFDRLDAISKAAKIREGIQVVDAA